MLIVGVEGREALVVLVAGLADGVLVVGVALVGPAEVICVGGNEGLRFSMAKKGSSGVR